MRFIVAVFITLCFAPVVATADSLSFTFGEMLARQGAAVEASLSFGPLRMVPWVSLDGAQFEGMVMKEWCSLRHNSVAVGPLVGSSNSAKTGALPYFGAEIRGKLDVGFGSVQFRLAERHTKETLLARFANVGVEAGPPTFKAKVSYQPIKRSNIWTQRLALRGTIPCRSAKIGLEVRCNLETSHKKTALVEVSLPLK